MSGRLGGWLDMAWGCIGALEFGHTVEKLEFYRVSTYLLLTWFFT